MDIVFTWVDDRFPGYLEALNRHAADPRDLNPNRTRDNLELLRFALRSVARNCPWARRIHLVTCRPQVPAWLDASHPRIRLVHHDEIIAPALLPTFNSFAIVSHLHLVPGLGERFVYFEDDMLALSPALGPALLAPDGRPLVHLARRRVTPRARLDPGRASPWNLALATADAALSRRYGGGGRRHVIHGPQVMARETMAALAETFPAELAATRAARFRAPDNVPPEFLAPHFALETGRAIAASTAQSRRIEGYVSIENLRAWTALQLAWTRARRKLSATLNDSFGARPNPATERMVRRWLESRFPDPAPWERPA